MRAKSQQRIDDVIGDKIRKLRTQQGLTQENLGDAVGISYQQIQKYETGANRISASRLFEIANVLGMPVAHFYEGLPNASDQLVTSPIEHGGNHRLTIELVRLFEQVRDADLRSSIVALMRNLVRQIAPT